MKLYRREREDEGGLDDRKAHQPMRFLMKVHDRAIFSGKLKYERG